MVSEAGEVIPVTNEWTTMLTSSFFLRNYEAECISVLKVHYCSRASLQCCKLVFPPQQQFPRGTPQLDLAIRFPFIPAYLSVLRELHCVISAKVKGPDSCVSLPVVYYFFCSNYNVVACLQGCNLRRENDICFKPGGFHN